MIPQSGMTDGDADEEAARDLIIVPGMRTDRYYPLEEGRAIAKLWVDGAVPRMTGSTGAMPSRPH
jgi:hypothetical protein